MTYGYSAVNNEDAERLLNTDRLKYIWGENACYLVNSRCVNVDSIGAYFYVGEVDRCGVYVNGMRLCKWGGYYGGFVSGLFSIRPVVSLPTSLQVVESNGIYDLVE